MYKIVDLGFEVPETGERRVALFDRALTKTASSEIQEFWDKLDRKEDSAYLWVIGVSAMEYYGCNNNGDAFTEADLKKYHHTFVENAHVFLHHVNKDPKKSIGKPVFSFYNNVMHRVELIMELSKTNSAAAETITKLKRGENIYVSMGCNVQHDVCSICGNKARTRGDYCVHLKYNLKKILPDGRQVYALNPNPKFFDISIVRKPADPTAFTLDKAASLGGVSEDVAVSSAELGEQAIMQAEKLAALKKLSDIVKEVDGCISDVKDQDGDTNVLRQVARRGFAETDYPSLNFDELMANKVGPLSLARSLISEGSPITFGDSMYMAGRHCFGDGLRRGHMRAIMDAVPGALRMLAASPMPLEAMTSGLLNSHEEAVPTEIVIRIIRPVAQSRAYLISKMASEEEIEKLASAVPMVAPGGSVGMPDIGRYSYILSQNVAGNLTPVTTVGADGRSYTTNLGEVRNNELFHMPGNVTKKAAGAALLLVALGALFSDADKAKNLATAIISGAAGAGLLASDSSKMPTEQGIRIPTSTAFHKSAAAAVAKPISKLVYTGMAVPGALSLDYLYNKLKYKDQDPEWHLQGVSKYTHRAGKFVTENPALSLAAGGVAGGALKQVLLNKGFVR